MIKTAILIISVSLEMMAQINVPNGGFNQFETISSNKQVYDVPVGWKEHRKNKTWRSVDGHGFAYKYDLPDANGNAVALHRSSSGSHITETNALFSSFLNAENHKNLRLLGRYKFSGSDIEETIDTLKIVAFSTSRQLTYIPDELPKNASVLDLTLPASQFEWFHLDVGEIKKGNYLTIVIQLNSGSDDSYYWGQSNAVLDDLKLITKK